jgi:DNA-binding transcriptional ArsR family regulator
MFRPERSPRQRDSLTIEAFVYNPRQMEKEAAIQALAALAQDTRLDVFRLLVRNEPAGLPAGEIARRLGVPHTTMSAHLGQLSRSGLIWSERQSRSIIYRARISAVHRLAAFLLEDCCGGVREACVAPPADYVSCPQEDLVNE